MTQIDLSGKFEVLTLEATVKQRRYIRWLSSCAVAVSAIGVLAGCGSVSPGAHQASAGRAIKLPTWRVTASLLVVMSGTLQGGADRSGRYCVWLQTAGGAREAVVWPSGFHARIHPLQVIDTSGAVYARGGHHVRLSGGTMPVKPGSRCMLGQRAAFFVSVP